MSSTLTQKQNHIANMKSSHSQNYHKHEQQFFISNKKHTENNEIKLKTLLWFFAIIIFN